MLKKFTFLYFLVIAACCILLQLEFHENITIAISYSFVPILLGLYYHKKIKFQLDFKDRLILIYCVLELISNIVPIIGLGETEYLLQMLITIVGYITLIDLFRLEGTYLVVNFKKKNIYFLIPLIITTIIFIVFVINLEDNSIYLLSLIFIVVENLFIWFATFRNASYPSKQIVLIGVYLKVIADIEYIFVFLFVNLQQKFFLTLQFLTYSISIYLIVNGFLLGKFNYEQQIPKPLESLLRLFDKAKKK